MSLTDATWVAIKAALEDDAELTQQLGAVIYDEVPRRAAFPYVAWASETWSTELASCVDGADGIIKIDVWVRDVTGPAGLCRRITDRVAVVLDDADLVLDAPYRTVELTVLTRRVMRDRDGHAWHGVVDLWVASEEAE